MQIAVVDLGVGNLRSVKQALKAVANSAEVVVSHDASVIEQADRLVLPGQGAIGTWFSALRERKLEQAVLNSMNDKPVLGICVGMQALFDYCEEDDGQNGLGLFQGSVRHFSHFHAQQADNGNTKNGVRLKIPQMGWNQVHQRMDHALWHGIPDQSHFYFVHSYCANMYQGQSQLMVAGSANYGHEFIAAVAHQNVFAVQFHPEKSHDDGLTLLKNFTQWSV